MPMTLPCCHPPPSQTTAGTVSGIGSTAFWAGSDGLADGVPVLSPAYNTLPVVASGGMRHAFDLDNSMHREVGGPGC